MQGIWHSMGCTGCGGFGIRLAGGILGQRFQRLRALGMRVCLPMDEHNPVWIYIPTPEPYSPPYVDRIWLWVYCNKTPPYTPYAIL